MIQFRAATVSDAAKINEVIHRAFRLYADELGPDSHVKALEEPQEKVLDDIAHNFVLVAEENGEVIGSIRIKRLNDDVAYVYRFGVDPLFAMRAWAASYCRRQSIIASKKDTPPWRCIPTPNISNLPATITEKNSTCIPRLRQKDTYAPCL